MSKTENPKPEVATYSSFVLGRVIVALRKARSLDQTELSRLIDRTQAVVSRIESGTTNLTTEQLWSIALAVGHSAASILHMVEIAELRLAQRGVALYLLPERVPIDAALCPRDWLDDAAKHAIKISGGLDASRRSG